LADVLLARFFILSLPLFCIKLFHFPDSVTGFPVTMIFSLYS